MTILLSSDKSQNFGGIILSNKLNDNHQLQFKDTLKIHVFADAYTITHDKDSDNTDNKDTGDKVDNGKDGEDDDNDLLLPRRVIIMHHILFSTLLISMFTEKCNISNLIIVITPQCDHRQL